MGVLFFVCFILDFNLINYLINDLINDLINVSLLILLSLDFLFHCYTSLFVWHAFRTITNYTLIWVIIYFQNFSLQIINFKWLSLCCGLTEMNNSFITTTLIICILLISCLIWMKAQLVNIIDPFVSGLDPRCLYFFHTLFFIFLN